MNRNKVALFAGLVLGFIVFCCLGATFTIFQLTQNSSPSTNTWIEIDDQNAGTKSGRFLFSNLAQNPAVALQNMNGQVGTNFGAIYISGTDTDGNPVMIIDTTVTHTTGDLWQLKNNGTLKANFDLNGVLYAGGGSFTNSFVVPANTITRANLQAQTVAQTNLVANSVNQTNLMVNSVNTSNILANAVVGTNIAANNINQGHLMANIVHQTNLMAGAVLGSNIVSGVLITNAGLTTPTISGQTTSNNASAGNVGEYVVSSIATGSAVPIANGVATNVTSISLTAGIWKVCGTVSFLPSSATITMSSGGISLLSLTQPSDGTEVYSDAPQTTSSLTNSVSIPDVPISLTATSNIFLVGKCVFSAGSVKAFGSIRAWRIR